MLSYDRKGISRAQRGALIVILLASASASGRQTAPDSAEMARKISDLTAMVEKLQARVDTLESRLQTSGRLETASLSTRPSTPSTALSPIAIAPVTSGPAATSAIAAPATPSTLPSLLAGTTINVGIDAYYEYNFNDPIGRVNLLRPYDVSSNAFALNQASLIFENAANPTNGKRWGLRLDLQYGQATETLQGSAINEPRPDIYRNIFQAYGTYVVPLGSGLTVDFGKWSSSLGIEGNYTKDQMNYSRSYLFTYLPYYHMGVRANYKFNDKIGVNYWVVNGTDQVEPFNGYKDESFGLNITPKKDISWTVNYYLGQEHPNVEYLPNNTSGNLPTFQGTPFLPIVNPATGKLHIFDSYVNLQASPNLTLAAEGDYVIERLHDDSAPGHVSAGAGYARYQLSPRWAAAGRIEYLSDRGGLFSGKTQVLREATVTLEQKLAEGFLLRAEWRRDSSNHPYFYTDTLGILKKEQNTATLGMVWWVGGKQGAW
jgi:Putative beta-barrel porin-2, OmpL-like. bbp2